MKKTHTTRLLTVVLTAATALITLPAAAQAGHRDRDRHAHARHVRGVPVVQHGAWCASRYDRFADHRYHGKDHRVHRNHHRYGHGAHRVQAHPYACRPCSRHFGSWKSFRKHVHHQHHVSPWRLSRLVVRYGPFWAFLG